MEKDFNDFNFLHYYVKRKMIKTQLINKNWEKMGWGQKKTAGLLNSKKYIFTTFFHN